MRQLLKSLAMHRNAFSLIPTHLRCFEADMQIWAVLQQPFM